MWTLFPNAHSENVWRIVPDGRQEGRGVQGTWGQAHREVENAGKELTKEVTVTIRQTPVRWRRWQTGMRT